jgi:flagellar hook-basal body protein
MIPAVNYALSALQASDRRMSVHANNVANVNSVGFKYSRALQATAAGGGTQISAIQQNTSQGPVSQTGISSDYALTSPGSFNVGAGQFTRNGAFNYNANGDLVTSAGAQVGNPLTVNAPDATVMQGYLEESNVDLATETVGQILAQRSFEVNLQTVRTSDQMMGTLLDMVA